MPRLRTPSLKVRQNQEQRSPHPKNTRRCGRQSKASTPSVSSRSATSKKRPKSFGKRRRHKPWDDDDDVHYDYESDSSCSKESDNDFYEPKKEVISDIDLDDCDDCANDNDGDGDTDIKTEISNEDFNFCPWLELEPENIPVLDLPESSNDIPLHPDHIMDVLEVYEILRSYSRILRLTPFIFEDFCAVLSAPENSCLLAEIHIALLKACLRSDDEDQIHYSATDTNNAFNIMVHALDYMTYAEVLRIYLEGDRAKNRVPPEILDAINSPNYPFVNISVRLLVITFLCYRFLDSNEFKKVVSSGGKLVNDDVCRNCGKGGDILACSTCETSLHAKCSSVPYVPEQEIWSCELCNTTQIRGVFNCLPCNQERTKYSLRMEPIGRDRHGRIFWLVARRIFIVNESENQLWYYSSAPQLYELVLKLDAHYFEYNLCKRICEVLPEILEQMAITVELTAERHEFALKSIAKHPGPGPSSVCPSTPFLHVDNVRRMSSILRDLRRNRDVKKPTDADDDNFYISLPDRLEPMLGITDGQLTNSFWAGNYKEIDVLQYDASEMLDPSKLYIMGSFKNDFSFRKYVNTLGNHELSESFPSRKKMLDRKKYMSSRFSLLDEGDGVFQWSIAKGHDSYGNEKLHTKYVEWAIAKLAKKVPPEMMHRLWSENKMKFHDELSKCESYLSLSTMLLRLECCMRRTLFLPQYWNSLGITQLSRSTPEDREQQTKEVLRRKKDEKDYLSMEDSEDGVIRIKYTKLKSGNCPQGLWRQKDELFRVLGRNGELGGWLWVSKTYVRRQVPVPEGPPIGILNMESSQSPNSPAVQKALRLHNLLEKLVRWRTSSIAESGRNLKCYSTDCRQGKRTTRSCYSPNCRASISHENGIIGTSGIAKCRQIKLPSACGVIGEDLPWPFPKPHDFRSRGSAKSSLIIIPQVVLRKLAKTGGRTAFYIPGFSLNAKSNFSIWNYPCARPCFDLCWRWLTSCSRSLHAVALFVKILWFCVKWSEFSPSEEESEDGRVIIHHPDRDELRCVVGHKEFPPLGTYERYLLKIEVVMLDDGEDEDESWSERSNRSEKKKRSSSRLKKAVHTRKSIKERQEWIDGVDLKVFEIVTYWKSLQPKNTAMIVETAPNSVQMIAGKRQIIPQSALPKKMPFTKIATENGQHIITERDEWRKRPLVPSKRLYGRDYVDPDDVMDILPSTSYCSQQTFASQEPAAKKPRVVLYNGTGVSRQNVKNFNRTMSNGFQFNGGYIRGGGKISQPVGDGMRRVLGGNIDLSSSDAQRRMGEAGYDEDVPPVISRYGIEERASAGADNTFVENSSVPTSRQHVSNTTTPLTMRPTAGNSRLLMIRKADGTTHYLKAREGQPTVTVQRANAGSDLMVMSRTGEPGRRIVSSVHSQSAAIGKAPMTSAAQVVRYTASGQKVIVPATSTRMASRPQVEIGDDTMNRQGAPVVIQQRVIRQGQSLTTNSGGPIRRIQRVVSSRPNRSSEQIYLAEESLGDYGFSVDVKTSSTGQIFRGSNVAAISRPNPRIVSRGGVTMSSGQKLVQSNIEVKALAQEEKPQTEGDKILEGCESIENSNYLGEEDYRRMVVPVRTGIPATRRVLNYNEFCMKRGLNERVRIPARSYRFEFESNEEEERAIAEAIAREEELMRLEEEANKREQSQWNFPRIIDRFGKVGINLMPLTKQPLQFSSNLMPCKDDSPDQKAIKQMLDGLITQVCRWDKQYGWYKKFQRPRVQIQVKNINSRRLFSNQREILLAEHIDRLKKEINKRRAHLEDLAEIECGAHAPWRKIRSKSKSYKRTTLKAVAPPRAINPDDISLGGDSWNKDKVMEDDVEELIEVDDRDDVNRKRQKTDNDNEAQFGKSGLPSRRDSKDLDSVIDVEPPKRRGRPPKALTTTDKSDSESNEGSVDYPMPQSMDANALHCTCQKPYNRKRFYLACGSCRKWFHGRCVGVTLEMTKNMSSWACEDCQPRYCICKTPYNDSMFYVGCDGCEGWFHPTCVGTTKEECERLEEYLCPLCVKSQRAEVENDNGLDAEDDNESKSSDSTIENHDQDDNHSGSLPPLNRADYPLLWKFVEFLMHDPMGKPFLNPNPGEYPECLSLEERMDLTVVQRKLNNLEYHMLTDFATDIRLMVKNGMKFFDPESDEFACASKLHACLQTNLMGIESEIRSRIAMELRNRKESESQIDSVLDIDTDQLMDMNLDPDALQHFLE